MQPDSPRAPVLIITGRPLRRRFEVILCSMPIPLSGTSFYYLFQLATYALAHPGQWLSKRDIEDTENQARYIYRLRQELSRNADGHTIVINNREGAYRLALDPLQIRFDVSGLLLHPDARVRKRVAQLQGIGSPTTTQVRHSTVQ
jgi:hypothetical protein